MEKFKVFLSGLQQDIFISPQASLSDLRSKLNQAEQYDFIYYNSFTKKKAILDDRNLEEDKKVEDIAFDQTTVIMTRVKGDRTDLIGMKTDWLHDRHTGVKITLNNVDENAIAANKDKFEPVMITDVQPTNPESSAFYDRVVICEKGSVINFDISSWGAAGFGYSIKSDKETICEYLYNSYGENQDRKSYSKLRRYKDSNNSIVIDSTTNLKVPTQEIIHYQKVTVKTWRLTSYKKNGKKYTSNTQAPSIHAQQQKTLMAQDINLFVSRKGGFDPGTPEGNIYIPGKDIETAAPGRGETSQQKFGSISNIKEDDPNNTVLGSVVFYFFVFKDKEAADRVINVLNTPNPSEIG